MRKAFQNMGSEQKEKVEAKGWWFWLNFHTQPWEADDSPYYGATMAAIAVGTAPHNYRSRPEIQGNLRALREYLQRGYQMQSPNNQVLLLWAYATMPGLLTPERQPSLI